jgi:hypothetical protein
MFKIVIVVGDGRRRRHHRRFVYFQIFGYFYSGR